LKAKLKLYQPFNEQEEKDKILILEALSERKGRFYPRERLGPHDGLGLGGTNPSHDKGLMVYHNIYNSWSWLGGHADGDEDLLSVAIREVKEESGVKDVKPLSNSIFSLEVLDRRWTYQTGTLRFLAPPFERELSPRSGRQRSSFRQTR
jgi:8-oxo-dGTP pyrophosphatase MutT (NUDIX family)